MGNLKNLKNLPNGDLCRIFAKETEELFQTERQSFLGVLQINLYKPNKMINIVSKEQPTPKIGTKEMEMKYSLHIQYAGTLSTKEVVAFAAKHTGMQSTAMKAALDSCCQTIELFLSMGYRVELGELGTFFATTNGTTVYSNVDAGLSQLKRLRVRFDANKELKQAVNSAEKRLVAIQKLVDPEKKIYQTISTNELVSNSEGVDGSGGNSGDNTDSGRNSGSGGGFEG